MDQKKISDLQMKIMLGEPLNDADRKILHESLECQEFKAIINNMERDQNADAPPAGLDMQILDFARENKPEKEQKPVLFFRVAIAVAAIILIAFAANFFINDTNENSPENNTAKNIEVVDPMAKEEKKLIHKKEQLVNLDINSIDAEMDTLESELDMMELDSTLDEYLTLIEE